MNDFMSAWAHFYPNCPPISHELKYAEPDRWLRFHYVPASAGRVARVDALAAALHVMNTAASEVLGNGSACWLAGPLYSPDDITHAGHVALYQRLNMPKVGHLKLPDDGGDVDIHAALVTWEPSRFDDVLRLIENDEAHVMWMCVETGAAFAPYDRGVDLILPTVGEVRRLSYEHRDWLSSYPGGW